MSEELLMEEWVVSKENKNNYIVEEKGVTISGGRGKEGMEIEGMADIRNREEEYLPGVNLAAIGSFG